MAEQQERNAKASAPVQFGWPCDPAAPLTQRFGENPQLYQPLGLPGHTGLDFGLASGSPVWAAAAGTVKRVVVDPNYGLHVQLTHPGGYLSLYAHLSRVQVKTGQRVKAGTVLGASGSSGFSTGPHLHFEVRLNQQPIDPFPLLFSEQQPQPQQPATPSFIPGRRLAKVLIGVNARSCPSTASSNTIIGALPAGLVVQVAGLHGSDQDQWAALRDDGSIWCAAQYDNTKFLDFLP